MHQNVYHRLLCKIADEPDSVGPLCPTHIEILQKQWSVDLGEDLLVYVPGEERLSRDVEADRAAKLRRLPASCEAEAEALGALGA